MLKNFTDDRTYYNAPVIVWTAYISIIVFDQGDNNT